MLPSSLARLAAERRITTQNLTVHSVDADKGLILIKGAVPGPRGSVVVVRTAAKAKGAEL